MVKENPKSQIAALEARVGALEAERDALRRRLAGAHGRSGTADAAAIPVGEAPESVTGEAVTSEHDGIASEVPGAGAAIAAAAPDSPSAEAVASLEPERGTEEAGRAA